MLAKLQTMSFYAKVYRGGVLSDTQFLQKVREKDGMLGRAFNTIHQEFQPMAQTTDEHEVCSYVEAGFKALEKLLALLESSNAAMFLVSEKDKHKQERHEMVSAILVPWITACHYLKAEKVKADPTAEVADLLLTLEKLSKSAQGSDERASLAKVLKDKISVQPLSGLWLFIIEAFSTTRRTEAEQWQESLNDIPSVVGESVFAFEVLTLFSGFLQELTDFACPAKDTGRIPLFKKAVSEYVQSPRYLEDTQGNWDQVIETYTFFNAAFKSHLNDIKAKLLSQPVPSTEENDRSFTPHATMSIAKNSAPQDFAAPEDQVVNAPRVAKVSVI